MKAVWRICLFVLPLLLLSVLLGGCARRGVLHPKEARVVMHRVEEGETLERIADEYYGDPSRASDIERVNGISEEEVEPGVVLQIVLSKKDRERLSIRRKARIPYNAGLELAARGSYLEAVGKFQEALATDRGFVDARYNLGVTYRKMKAYEKALVQFREVTKLRPEDPAYHFALGNCLYHLERYEEALGAFQKVVELDPTHMKARYSMAMSLEKMGQRESAIKAWEEYLRFDGTSEWAREAKKRLEKLKR